MLCTACSPVFGLLYPSSHAQHVAQCLVSFTPPMLDFPLFPLPLIHLSFLVDSVDKRGRKVNVTSSEDLRKYYDLDGELSTTQPIPPGGGGDVILPPSSLFGGVLLNQMAVRFLNQMAVRFLNQMAVRFLKRSRKEAGVMSLS